jgi:hypothetical protein
MNIDKLKQERDLVVKRAQELTNENLRLEGEYRRLEAQIAELEKDSGDKPETVEEGTTDAETTQAG